MLSKYFKFLVKVIILSMSLIVITFAQISVCIAQSGTSISGTYPQEYTVQKDDAAGFLTLSTPYYTIQHDLKKGGVISKIHYTYGKTENLLVQPIATRLVLAIEKGRSFNDINNSNPIVSLTKSGKSEIVTVECSLLDNKGQESGIKMKTVYNYRWGYIKIHKEFSFPYDGLKVKNLNVLSTIFDPGLSDYGYRQGVMEQESASPSSFGVCQWRKMRAGTHFDPPLQTRYVPRYLVLANQGIEGIEWFVSSDLSQWDYQITDQPGNGLCQVSASMDPHGVAVSIYPINLPGGSVEIKGTCAFDYYIGMPILEGHATKPWLHTGFARNKGNWLTEEQIEQFAESGIRTMHCHNDGDYNDDGLFWRDGSYPPYPPDDMKKYDKVIETAHQNGIRVATYFSNKELHPTTEEFKKFGEEWGRKPDDQQKLLHNYYRGDEFGAQMCLKSGWLEFLKFSIDRVLKNHKLDGVYYDWNVALFCNNPLHVGKTSNNVSGAKGLGALALSETGHWDMDELIDLMEWTRERVGPNGLIILHNTMAPMFVTENFANYVVGMEWGYGLLLKNVPPISDLPLEWNFVGARSRGVIGYGTIAKNAPHRLHQLLALETLLTGVAPWPASDEALKLYKILKPLGDIEQYKFEDFRNKAVKLSSENIASAVYSKSGESYILIGNFDPQEKQITCKINLLNFAYPLISINSCEVISGGQTVSLNVSKLTSIGEEITVPGDNAVLVHVK